MKDAASCALEELLNSSRLLATYAADGDWNAVRELQGEHHDQVVAIFAMLDRDNLSTQMLSDLAHVRVYTDIVLSLAQRKISSLGDAVKQIKTGRNAVRSYADYGA